MLEFSVQTLYVPVLGSYTFSSSPSESVAVRTRSATLMPPSPDSASHGTAMTVLVALLSTFKTPMVLSAGTVTDAPDSSFAVTTAVSL